MSEPTVPTFAILGHGNSIAAADELAHPLLPALTWLLPRSSLCSGVRGSPGLGSGWAARLSCGCKSCSRQAVPGREELF